MTLSPKLGVVGISTLWHFRLPLPIQMFIKVASSPRLSGSGMPSPILWSHPLKMQRIVLLSSLLWWELGANSQITSPGEWLSVRRFTSKLSWSWSWSWKYILLCIIHTEIFVVIDNLVLSAWDDQHSRKLLFFFQIVSTESGVGEWSGEGCYIFSILIYIVEYVIVVKLNTIRLKPKTSGPIRNTLKCVKIMICAIPRNRESVTFRRLLHINRYLF